MYMPLQVFVFLSDDCVTLTDGDQSNQEFSVPQMKWFETPSVIQYGAGNFTADRSRGVRNN